MIYESLTCLAEEMNEYFRNKLKIQENHVVVSGIVNQDATVAIPSENKLVITLLNATKDMGGKSNSSAGIQTTSVKAAPIYLQLHLVIAAYFSASNYGEALRFLSFVIAFLQEKNVFTHANTPRLDNMIEKLIFEMETYDTDKLSTIWSTLGAKYMPSLFYRIRMITFDSTMVKEYRPLVTQASANPL